MPVYRGRMAPLQASLLDDLDDVGLRSLAPIRRTQLTAGAWVDVRPGWLTGAGTMFERLASDVPWRGERRQMYDRRVDVPRLLCFYDEHEPLPDPVLAEAREALTAHYAAELGEPFRTAGLCYYRDGKDSVAPRALLLRPRGGGQTLRYALGLGDLIVMGGSCQRTWEHAVPKTAKPVGPRISIQFRPRGVR